MTDAQVWPTELRLHKDRKTLTITYDGGEQFDLPAEYLRVKSPSAEVQGHSPDERKTVPGKRNVEIIEVLPVGNYAVRLVFDDMAAFIAAIIGGFNQVRGAILGGLILGVLDNLSAAYISSQYRGAFPLIILIAVILLRPQVLLGRLEERTV